VDEQEFNELWKIASEYWPKLAGQTRQIGTLATRCRHLDQQFVRLALDDAGISGKTSPPWKDILSRAIEAQNNARKFSSWRDDTAPDCRSRLTPTLRSWLEFAERHPGRRHVVTHRNGEQFEIVCERFDTAGFSVCVEIRLADGSCDRPGWRRIVRSESDASQYSGPVVVARAPETSAKA